MSAEAVPDPHHERRRIAEAFPGPHTSPDASPAAEPSAEPSGATPSPARRPSPRHRQPTPDEIRQAQYDYEHHVPSMFTRQCLADGCGEWPCRPYREAVQTLRDAGLLPDPPA